METKKEKATISLSGMGAITPNENNNGVLFEFWADDPEGQQVETMKVKGTAQLMRSGSFFFVPGKPRARTKSTLLCKAAHGRLSVTVDGAYQLTLKLFKREGLDVKSVLRKEAVELIDSVRL